MFFMAYTHVAHDCHLGDYVIMVNYAGLSGYVEVEDRAFISAITPYTNLSALGIWL
jgi:UDP-N-acetylglucosamine acyltransferase